ncbi:MAG: phosphoribosylformylglycinamidine cyclo-ligase [Candidatus Latescibacterota bacterium]
MTEPSKDQQAPTAGDGAVTYAAAGVDIDAQTRTTHRIRDLARTTFSPEVLTDIGLFGGLFAPNWQAYKEPVLVSSTDGVGTKLKVAFMMDKHDTVGLDIVNHCVNDILAQGAQPLFFMDYLAMGKHREDVALDVISGMAAGCREAGCALLGGEMAELPEFYQPGEYDLAGMIVGMVDRSEIVDGSSIEPGDILLGLGSDGLHTNGYSLARKLLFQVRKLRVGDHVETLDCTVGEELLRPHRSYLKSVSALMKQVRVKGIAHITGGGLIDNIPRILPEGTSAHIRLGSWAVPPIFRLLEEIGHIASKELFRTFNMGIGMVIVVNEREAQRARKILETEGERVYSVGEIVSGERDVCLSQ